MARRPFHHQNYGGYLRWHLEEPIFWDGRNLLFASLMAEVAQMPLDEVVEKWEIDSLLLTEFEYQQMVDQIVPAQWALVYWDDFSALFLRRDRPPNRRSNRPSCGCCRPSEVSKV